MPGMINTIGRLATITRRRGGGVPMITLPQLFQTDGTIYEGFDNVADWTNVTNGAVAQDNTHIFPSGTGSVRCTSNAGAVFQMDKNLNNVVFTNPAYLRISLYYSSAALSVITFRLLLASQTNFSKYFYTDYSYGLKPGWNHIVIPQSAWVDDGTGESWANPMKKLRVRMSANVGVVAQVSFDSLMAVTPIPVMLVTLDDIFQSQWDNAYPITRAHNIPVTEYVATYEFTDLVTPRMTIPQLQVVQANGWVIANHSRNHTNWTAETVANIQAEIQGGHDDLVANGFTAAADHVAYPWGVYNANVATAMTNLGYKTGRTVNAGNAEYAGNIDLLRVPAKSIGSTETLQNAKDYIDAVKAAKGVGGMLFHQIIPAKTGTYDYEFTTADFAEAMAYLAASGVTPITIMDLYNALSGPVTVRRPV